MYILNKENSYSADENTLKSQNISSSELMERAGKELFKWLNARYEAKGNKFYIFCGIGNNGGDGLVLARLLLENEYAVKVYVVNFSDKRSDDFLLNIERLEKYKLRPEILKENSTIPDIGSDEIIIDAIFGIGLNRPPEAWVKKILIQLNGSGNYRIAIDIPSGLYLDAATEDKNAIFKASTTLTIEAPKLVFYLPETATFVGELYTLSIGLDLSKIKPNTLLIDRAFARSFYRPRKKISHKGTYGHCLIVGGSYGKMGSVVLCATAAMRIGTGKVTTLIPKCGYTTLQTSLPEAMVLTGEADKMLVPTPLEFEPEAICFGVGAGTTSETVTAFDKILMQTEKPMVIDADGLNILAKNPKLLNKLPEQSILTPHPKELERLIGTWKNDFEKVEKVKKFTKRYDCVLVVKGASTLVISSEKIAVNSTGNPGMATAGSGDTLTGIIGGLLAQHYSPWKAAVLGVYMHGLAGDKAAENLGHDSLIAGDLHKYLAVAFQFLLKEDS